MSRRPVMALVALISVALALSAADASATKGVPTVLDGPGAGEQLGTDGKTIEKCPPGSAKSSPGAFRCRKCSGKNSYQDRAGQSQCKTCPSGPGYVVDAGHTSCTYFGPGMEPSKSGKPAKCAKGFAKAGAGPFRCTACKGTAKSGGQRYSNTLGATACKECPVGGTVNPQRTSCTVTPTPTKAATAAPTPAPFFFNPCLPFTIVPGGSCATCPGGCLPTSSCVGGICGPFCTPGTLSAGQSCLTCAVGCMGGTWCNSTSNLCELLTGR